MTGNASESEQADGSTERGFCGVVLAGNSCPIHGSPRDFDEGDELPVEPVRIPRDKAKRDRLAQMAGLTAEERLALDRWCNEQATEDERRRRRGLERLGDDPVGGHFGSTYGTPTQENA